MDFVSSVYFVILSGLDSFWKLKFTFHYEFVIYVCGICIYLVGLSVVLSEL